MGRISSDLEAQEIAHFLDEQLRRNPELQFRIHCRRSTEWMCKQTLNGRATVGGRVLPFSDQAMFFDLSLVSKQDPLVLRCA